MTWNSTLKRNTPLKAKAPLKAKGGFKPSCGFENKAGNKQPNRDGEKPTRGKETVRKPKIPSKSGLMLRLDMVFSLFIRLRDAMDGGKTRCISCGRVFPFEQMQCGHYHGRRSLCTRWDEDNCHSECSVDNCSNPNHLDGYTQNLIAKIGQERFNALAARANSTRKWSESELREMIAHYTAECRRLGKKKGIRIRL